MKTPRGSGYIFAAAVLLACANPSQALDGPEFDLNENLQPLQFLRTAKKLALAAEKGAASAPFTDLPAG